MVLLDQQRLLSFYSILQTQNNFFNIYFINKGNGKRRKIISPAKEYLEIQEIFLNYFIEKNIFKVHDSSYAWSNGRGREDCARELVGSRYIYTTDIKSYFDNIKHHHLINLFKSVNLENYVGISNLDLANFFTVEDNKGKRFCPQGFKTSPLFANAVRYGIDEKISSYANINRMKYVNYGDNLFLAGEVVPYNVNNYINYTLSKYGFQENIKKRKMMPYYSRQDVLSIVVNEKLSVDKDYKSFIIKDLVNRINNKLPLDPSIKGKVNVFKLNSNPRDYKYLQRLMKKVEEANNE